MKATVKAAKKHFMVKEEGGRKRGGLKVTAKMRFLCSVFGLGLTIFLYTQFCPPEIGAVTHK